MSALAGAVRHRAVWSPDAVALLWEGQALNWRQLHARAMAAASVLQGASAGVVALCSGSPRELAIFAYGCGFAGRTFMPLSPLLSRERRESLLAAAGEALRFGEGDLDPAPVLDAFAAGEGAVASGTPPLSEVEMIIATSGSSGEPKGVMLSPDNLLAAAAASAARLPLAPGDVWLACLPLHHIGGMAILHRCAQAGAAVLLHPRFDPARILEDLARHSVTHLSLVPPMLLRLAEAGSPPPALRAALVGGGELSLPVYRQARAAGWPVLPTYGLSETCSQVATFRDADETWRPGCVGSPLPGVVVDIPAPDEAGLGRVRVRGGTVMRGYLNPGLRPGEGLQDRAFLTADLGRLDDQGRLILLGRADDMLVSGGVNVHPAEAERVLADAPGVDEVAVSGRRDAVWGALLVVVYRGGAEPAALEAWCREHLPGHPRPRAFLRVESLPLSPEGKLDRRALRRIAETTS